MTINNPKNNPPNPNVVYPIANCTRTCFLKNIIQHPQIEVGDYSYYDDPDDVHQFEKNVLYLFDFIGDKLKIGKFCQIATGVRFMMNGGNHPMDGITTYPFKAFGQDWQEAPLPITNKGDTIIGHDVWIGNSVTIMQGIQIGHGAIIATNAVVTKNVEPYSIVGGNPAKLIRKRFPEDKIAFLLVLAWWDWPVEKITQNLVALTSADFDALKKE